MIDLLEAVMKKAMKNEKPRDMGARTTQAQTSKKPIQSSPGAASRKQERGASTPGELRAANYTIGKEIARLQAERNNASQMCALGNNRMCMHAEYLSERIMKLEETLERQQGRSEGQLKAKEAELDRQHELEMLREQKRLEGTGGPPRGGRGERPKGGEGDEEMFGPGFMGVNRNGLEFLPRMGGHYPGPDVSNITTGGGRAPGRNRLGDIMRFFRSRNPSPWYGG